MNLSVTAAAPAPAAPGSASAAGTGAGSAFQTLLDALAVLPQRRQVPGPPAAELLAAESGSGTGQLPGLEMPGLSATLPGLGAGTASEMFGFPPAAGTPAAAPAIDTESGAAPAAGDTDPVLPAAAAPDAGAHGPALAPAVLPGLLPVPVTPAHARQPAAPGTPGVSGTLAASKLPGPAPVSGSQAGADGATVPALAAAAAAAPGARAAGAPAGAPADPPAAAAPSFRFPGLQGTGLAQRPPAAQVSSGEAGFVSEVPGTPAAPMAGLPAMPAAQQAAAVPAAAPAAPPSAAGQPQLHTQLAKPVFSLLAAGAGEHVMTLKVTPESLGTVTVRAVIGTEGVRLELFAADAGRDAVRAVLPELRRELAGSGFNATLDLGTGSRPDGQDRGQEQQRRPGSHEAPEIPVPAARAQDPAPSHRIPDGASALDLLA